MNSITKRVGEDAKYSCFPASYHCGALIIPIFVKTSGSSIPTTPNIAQRLLTSSAWTYHFKFSGSSASPRGSNPLSPGRLKNFQLVLALMSKIVVYLHKPKFLFLLTLQLEALKVSSF